MHILFLIGAVIVMAIASEPVLHALGVMLRDVVGWLFVGAVLVLIFAPPLVRLIL